MSGAIPLCDINKHLPWSGSINFFGPSLSGKSYFIEGILQERKKFITNAFVVVGGEAATRYRKIFPSLCVFDNLEEAVIRRLNATLIEHTSWWRDYEAEYEKLAEIAKKLFPLEKERKKYIQSRAKIQRPLLVVIFDDLMTDKLMGKEKSIIVNLVTKFRHNGVLTFITSQRINAKISQSIVESAQATVAFTFNSLAFNKKLMDKIGSDFTMTPAKFNDMIDHELPRFSPDHAKIKVAFIRTNLEHKVKDKNTGEIISTRMFYGIAPKIESTLTICDDIFYELSEKHMDKDYTKNVCFGSLDKTCHIDVKKLVKSKKKSDEGRKGETFYLDLSKG